MIEFNLLGEIGLHDDADRGLDRLLRQPKRLALLAYLASPVPGTWHRRDTLLALFWPETDAGHARSALRNGLYVLRQLLGDAVIRNRGDEEISVDPLLLATDVAGLRTSLAEGATPAALSRYRGELMAGFFAPDSPGFERWLDGERLRLRLEVVNAGRAWVDLIAAEGRHRESLGALHRLLEIDPYDETLLRRLMLAHEAVGDPPGAILAFESYRQRLAEDLAATPAEETLLLADRLRGDGTAAGSPSGRQPPRPSVLGSTGGQRQRRGTRSRLLGVLGAVAIMLLAMVAVRDRIRGGRDPIPTIGRSVPVTIEDGLQVEPALSPTGRLVAYASGTSRRMRILVRRVAGGDPWPLAPDAPVDQVMPRWSPDDDTVLFLADGDAFLTAAVGGTPRRVASAGEGEGAGIRSASWSPRGDSLLVVRRDSLLVIPLEGPGGRLVGTGTQIHSCSWSPDERWIACVSGNWIAMVPGTLFGNRAPSTVVLFPATGGTAVPLTDRANQSWSPTWAPDGHSLWLLSDADGVHGGARAIPIGRNGHPGDPVKLPLVGETISISGGRLAYSVPIRRANIWTIAIPGDAPIDLGTANQLTTGNQVIEVVRVSGDGRWLTFDSDLRGNSDIYRMALSTGERPERLTDDPRPEFAGALSPGNAELAYHLWEGGARRLWIRDLTSGVASPALPSDGDQGVPAWSPDGTALALWDHGREPGDVFMVRRGADGVWQATGRRILDAQLPAWAPDGRSLAVVTAAGGIAIVPADSGAGSPRYRPRPGTEDPLATFLTWDPVSHTLWFLGHRPDGRGGVWGLPDGGGPPRLAVDFTDVAGRLNGPSVASDGHRFYFTLEEQLSNVRLAELTSP